MIRMTTALMTAIVVCFSVLFAVPASAQPSTDATLQDDQPASSKDVPNDERT